MTEASFANYTETYQYRKVPASFFTFKDDAPAIVNAFRSLESVEKPNQINALVLGVGGCEATKKAHEIFWEGISKGNSNDTLSIVDIREFTHRDYDAIQGTYSDRTCLFQEDARSLPFPDGSFNLILSHCFFPCLNNEDLDKVLKEINRVTVIGGLGIHTFRDTLVTGRVLRKIWSTVDRKNAGCVYYDRSRSRMKELLNKNGFDIRCIKDMSDQSENITYGCVKGI